MISKKCELETIGQSVESLWNRLFHADVTFVSQISTQVCQIAEANIISAIFLAIILPFIEAFVPALPYTAFVLFNVSLLGGLLGFILSVIGTVAGSWILFFIVRFFFQKKMLNFLKKHNQLGFYNKIVAGVEKHGILYIFIIYGVLGLILPSSLCTISLGLTAFSKRKFFIGLLAGKTVITGMLALFGKSITQIFENPLLLIAVVLFAIIGYFVSKKVGKHLEF